jgi:hypothetical protein
MLIYNIKRVYLTKEEKVILRCLYRKKDIPLSKREEYVATKSLEAKCFVKGTYQKGYEVQASRLLPQGESYISKFPNLYNPLNIDRLLSIISLVIALFALFFPCN